MWPSSLYGDCISTVLTADRIWNLVINLYDARLTANGSFLGITHISGKESPHRALGHMSRVVRKPAFCICENKDADQLRGNREADQRLCFRYTDSTVPLLPK